MMTTITKSDAPTLDALAGLLNGYAADPQLDGRGEPLRVDEIYDVTSLPTYGGEEPYDTLGIYSWDETRLLYCDGPDGAPWVLGPRDEEEA